MDDSTAIGGCSPDSQPRADIGYELCAGGEIIANQMNERDKYSLVVRFLKLPASSKLQIGRIQSGFCRGKTTSVFRAVWTNGQVVVADRVD